MTAARTRLLLFAIFFTGLIVQALAVILAYAEHTIRGQEVSALITRLLTVYAVHFAVILAGIFAGQPDSGRPVAPTPFWVAVAVALSWNLLLVWRSIAFGWGALNPAGEDGPAELMSYLDLVADRSSFLVVGALSFFFAKDYGPSHRQVRI